MAKTSKTSKSKIVATITHGKVKRTNIPTAEYQAVMAEDDRNPIQVAYKRRNRDLDPQFVWRGKDHQDWSDLVVQAPPLFIQEKVHPKAADRGPATAGASRGRKAERRNRFLRRTCSPISTGLPSVGRARPSSTSMTPTDRTG